MNIVPRVFEGEVLTPQQMVRVIGRPRPFQQAIIDKRLPAGMTVDELVDLALGDKRSNFSIDYYVCLDGEPIPAEWRNRIRVKQGTVTFAPRLQKKSLKSIALIAVAVVALVVAPFIAGPLLGLTGTALAIGTGLIGAGVVVAGSLAVNALFPTASPSVTAAARGVTASVGGGGGGGAREGVSNAFSITGARNTSDPFGPIPTVYGLVRVWPRYAAVPYVEFVGEDQYLRLLFCVGYGPLFIHDIKIGETDIGDFEGVNVETFHGFPADTDPTLYPGVVFQDQLSIELSTSEWNERTTAEDIDVIQVDVSLPNGYYRVDTADGKFKSVGLDIDIEYRLTGTGPWFFFGTFANDVKKTKPFTLGWSVAAPVRGQYDVRVRKSSDNTVPGEDSRDAYWVSLKGLRYEKPIHFNKDLALIAVRIKASGQLNNVIDSLNCMAMSYTTGWNGASWVANTLSTNPADIFRWILQGPAIYSPVPDEQLDLDSLEAWHSYCASEGWQYNREHDTQTSVLEALRMVAAAGRARVVRTDGKWGVIHDEADPPVAQHFTPRNSWGFEEVRAYAERPDAFRVNFINAAKGYVPDERRVYDDGKNVANSTKFEAIDFPGVTDAGSIWRLGRFQMAQYQLRPSTYSLMTNWQALSCTIGSRVYCAHDVTLWGQVQGRVVTVAGDVITLDQEVVYELGNEYQIRFREPDGTSVLRAVEWPGFSGNSNTVTLLPSALPDPLVGDLVMFGEDVTGPAVLLRVLEIEWMPDLRARVTLVDDAPEISDADTGDIPEFDSQITSPVDMFARAPNGIAVREILYIRDNVAYADAAVSWQALVVSVANFELQMRNDGDPTPTFEVVDIVPAHQLSVRIVDLEAGTYSFRVRSLFKNGWYSEWNTLNLVDFTGTLNRPDDVSNFRISVLGDTATLTWDAIFGQGVAYYVIRHSPVTFGAAWGSSSILLDRITSTNAQVGAVNGTYMIKAATLAGSESLEPSHIIFTGQALVTLNIVEAVVPEIEWNGSKTDLSVVNDRLFLFADDVEGVYVYQEFVELSDTYTSRITPSILAFGDDPTNVMSSWETLLSVASLSGAEAADWTILLEERHVVEATQIDTSAGSNIGTLTGGGGLAAAFDLDTTQTSVASASLAAATSSYVGKTLTTPAAITHAIAWGTSDAGFLDTPGATLYFGAVMATSGTGIFDVQDVAVGESISVGTLDLYGKTGSAPANATDGTLIGTTVLQDINITTENLVIVSDDVTQWDHVWLNITSPGAATHFVSELELFEAVGEGWTDWAEVRLSDMTARAFQFRLTVTSLNPAIDVHVEYADISVDMPDRLEALGDESISAGGSNIVFNTPFRHLETVLVTAIQDAGSGDYAVITNRTEEGYTIQIKDSSNVGVARIIDAVAAGYGRRIT